MKKCSKCYIEKNKTEFSLKKDSKDGYNTYCKLCKKEYDLTNILDIKKRKKNYRIINKKEISEYRKKWYANNLEYYTEYNKINPHKMAFRNLLRHTLERLGKPKEGYTIDILGYSALELKEHLERLFTAGMSWDNYGEWHIDHIIGVVNFDKNTQPNVVNALTNLQPLWATTREINGIIYEGNLNRKKF